MTQIKYLKKKDKIVIEIPFFSKRINPYMEDEDVGEYPTLTGLIINHKEGWSDIGFAMTIDLDYASKSDQFTDICFIFDGEEKEFKKLCKKWGISLAEMDA